jgi:hypothetical protein
MAHNCTGLVSLPDTGLKLTTTKTTMPLTPNKIGVGWK